MSIKQCPYCGEDILAVAILCKHCKSDLVNNTNSIDKAEHTSDSIDIENHVTAKERRNNKAKRNFVNLCLWAVVIAGYSLYSSLESSDSDDTNPDLGAAVSDDSERVGNEYLERVFNHWNTKRGNEGDRTLTSSELYAQGTVLSNNFNLDVDPNHRSPSVMACFVYAETVYGIYNSNAEMCILDIRHPESRYVFQKHRGHEYIGDIWTELEGVGYEPTFGGIERYLGGQIEH